MTRNGPFRREFAIPLQAIHTELNRLFDEYWTPTRLAPTSSESGPTLPTAPSDPGTWTPPIDLSETLTAYLLSVEVPGVEPSTIELSVTGNVLSIKGTKPVEEDVAASRPLRERKFGVFSRQVILPGEVEFDGAEAEARNGVLKVKLPKLELPKPQTIPVQAR